MVISSRTIDVRTFMLVRLCICQLRNWPIWRINLGKTFSKFIHISGLNSVPSALGTRLCSAYWKSVELQSAWSVHDRFVNPIHFTLKPFLELILEGMAIHFPSHRLSYPVSPVCLMKHTLSLSSFLSLSSNLFVLAPCTNCKHRALSLTHALPICWIARWARFHVNLTGHAAQKGAVIFTGL